MNTTSLSQTESWGLLTLSIACLAILGQTFHGDGAPLVASIAFSGLAFAMTYSLTRWLGPTFIKAGLKGKDIGKARKPEIPETMGAICAVVYLLIIIVFIPFPFYKDIVAATSGGGNKDYVLEVDHVETGRFLHRFPHSKLASYLSAILSLQSIVLLGVGDDLFDIRWRHKLFIPAFASIPILIVYFVDFGVTKIVVPTMLRPYLGDLLELGVLYYIYMSGISIFCPNSINIVAGINGIEVGQSVVIAVLILVNDAFYLYPFNLTASATTTMQHPATDSHLFSTYLLLPFLGASLALLTQNWYPARLFVGDTYCYFAGMVFAVVAILGHFSKTLLLLLIPQIFNFLYSAPQLFGLVPCPRHRLPHFNARTGLLEPSWADFTAPIPVRIRSDSQPPSHSHSRSRSHSRARSDSRIRSDSLTTSYDYISDATNGDLHGNTTTPPNGQAPTSIPTKPTSSAPTNTISTKTRAFHPLIQTALKLLSLLRLIRIETDPSTGQVTKCTNMTILNLWLVWFGPLREDRLCIEIMLAQACIGMAGLWVRHKLGVWVFEIDNLVLWRK